MPPPVETIPGELGRKIDVNKVPKPSPPFNHKMKELGNPWHDEEEEEDNRNAFERANAMRKWQEHQAQQKEEL